MTQPRIAGGLLFAAIVLSILHGLWPTFPAMAAGLAAWLAGLLLLGRLRGIARIQTLAMFIIGTAGLTQVLLSGGAPQWTKALTANQALLAMLAAVSFLRLISLPSRGADIARARGSHALWRTLVGVHLFGAVINLSAVMIFGDRLAARHALTPLQATVLSRGFALAAHWSPFFAAMGIALGNAPGSDLFTLSTVGLPLALVGLGASTWQLRRHADADGFVGYPLNPAALRVPALLAVAVMLLHALLPDIPILSLISLSALSITALTLLWGGRVREFTRHIGDGLPGMSGELLLFLAAGVLAAGIASVVANAAWQLPLAHFGANAASLLLVLMVALSLIGVHPVISIATASGLLLPLAPDPNLLGITFLMSWAAGVTLSPFSGMHLAMQGRFGIDARGFVRWNGRYTLFMLAIDSVALHLYELISRS